MKLLIYIPLFFALFFQPAQANAAIKELSKTQQAYLKFPEYRKVALSNDGKLAAVATTFDNKSHMAVMERKTKKILSSAVLGKNYKVSNFIWVDDKKLLVIAYKEEGLLKGDSSKQYVYKHKVGNSSLKQIFPSVSSSEVSSGFFQVLSTDIIDDQFLLVSQYRHYGKSIETRLKKLNINRGRLTLYDNVKVKRGIYGIDNNLKARFAYGTNDNLGFDYYTKNLKTNKWNKSKFWNEKDRGMNVLGFSKDNKTFYFLGDNKKTIKSLYKANIDETGNVSNIKEMFSYPKGDIIGASWDKETHMPFHVEFGNGKPMKKYFSKSGRAQLQQALDKSFPNELIYVGKKKGDDYLATVISDSRPTTFYVFNEKKKEIREFLSSNELLRGLPTSKAEAFEYKARDGKRITGFLYKPKKHNKNTPLIMFIHGGPYGIYDRWRFDGDLQLLVSEGYSVMQVNYRGSGARGQKFEEEGYGKQGKEMQYDLADANLWAVKKGVVKKGNTCIWGISYGGYAAMMSTHMFPELFKCGIGFGGVYDWRLIHKNDSYGNALAKKMLEKILPKTDKEKFEQSPVALAAKLKKPVYILHGTDDVRVPLEQAEVLKKALDKANKKYKYKEFEDIGHWFVSNQKKKNTAYVEILNFLDENLKK